MDVFVARREDRASSSVATAEAKTPRRLRSTVAQSRQEGPPGGRGDREVGAGAGSAHARPTGAQAVPGAGPPPDGPAGSRHEVPWTGNQTEVFERFRPPEASGTSGELQGLPGTSRLCAHAHEEPEWTTHGEARRTRLRGPPGNSRDLRGLRTRNRSGRPEGGGEEPESPFRDPSGPYQ